MNRKFKHSVSFMVLFFGIAQLAMACWQGCVVDKCTGEPLAGYPIRYYDPNANGGVGGGTTFTTDSDGCFSYSGDVGSQISINGQTYSYNGGPCRQLGNVSAYGLTSWLGARSRKFHLGSPNDVGVWNSQFYGCNDNFLQFGYMAEDLSNYCIKIEVFQLNGWSSDKVISLDWTEFVDEDGRPLNDLSSIMSGFPRDTYTIRVAIKCCDDKDDDGLSNGVNGFSGNFVWQPDAAIDDVDFDWVGSSGTEAINNDGNPNNNIHPNDGTIWQLGELTCGTYIDLSSISNNVSQITVRLEQMVDCLIGGPVLYEQTYNSTGSVPAVLNFNQLTSAYFLTSSDYTKGETCFQFTIEAKANNNCPAKVNSGIFQIADNCAFCLTANDVTPEMAAEVGLTSTMLSAINTDSRDGIEFSISPNPVQDILYITGGEQVKNMSILSSAASVMYNGGKLNQINIQDYPSGLYFVKCVNIDGTTQTYKIIKE